MATERSITDNLQDLLTPKTPGEAETAANALKCPGESLAPGDDTIRKTAQTPAHFFRATKVEVLTPREMEVLALAWDNMRDSRIDYKEMSVQAGYTEESARVAMGKIKRKLANAAASEREKRGLGTGQSARGRPKKADQKQKALESGSSPGQ